MSIFRDGVLQFRECASFHSLYVIILELNQVCLLTNSDLWRALLSTEVILMLLFSWQMVLWITALHGLFHCGKQVLKDINTGLGVLQQHL